MNFKTAQNVNVGVTCLQGSVDVSYQRLVEAFGEPEESDGYKVDAEWIVESDSGIVLTIYNYKTGKNYCGADGEDVEDIRDWHIGGDSKEGVQELTAFLA